jgi:hypothetical protein
MIISEDIQVNITNRNITKYRSVFGDGVNLGAQNFNSIELYSNMLCTNYNGICDHCSENYKVIIKDKRNPDRFTSLCGRCRSNIANEKMKATLKTDAYKEKKSKKLKWLYANDEVFLAAQLKARESRKNGYCKTERARQVSIKNLTWKYGASHHNYNPNKVKYKEYMSKVKSYERDCVLNLIDNYNSELRGLCGVDGAYQLDHIVSIKYGFINNIDPYIIGHYCNLQFIPWQDNRSKSSSSTEEDLKTLTQAIIKFDSIIAID